MTALLFIKIIALIAVLVWAIVLTIYAIKALKIERDRLKVKIMEMELGDKFTQFQSQEIRTNDTRKTDRKAPRNSVQD